MKYNWIIRQMVSILGIEADICGQPESDRRYVVEQPDAGS
jgi:hypothetical protein